jgi:serine/threonine protein kinase/formylglycine-generating enzyme required for sulfatase activity
MTTTDPDDLRTEHGSPEALFAAWAVRAEAGESLSFDEFLEAHAAHAEALLRLHEDWKLFAPLLGKVVPGLIASSSLHVAPLSGGDEDSEMPSAELLDRLGIHAPNTGRYRFRAVLGRGGGGVVLKVWDTKLNRPLAMKVVLGRGEDRPTGATPKVDSRTLTRFVDEARIASQLNHPGIVPVHELGADESGRAFFTMKLVKGEDLSKIFEKVKTGEDGLNQTRALGVLLKVCEAMSFAHAKGVIHRDLKPANIMVGRYGEVHVMDWGLARVLAERDHRDLRIRPHNTSSASVVDSLRGSGRATSGGSPLVTLDGTVLGTPVYMPPEQARGELDSLGPQSDVYAIGAMLYELLAKRPPFIALGEEVSPYTALLRVIDGSPQSLMEIESRLPAELVAICERAMARQAQSRYQNTSSLAEDLRAYLEHRVVQAHDTGTWAETRKWVQRNKPLATSLAGIVLVLGLALAVSWEFKVRADDQRRVATAETDLVLMLWAQNELKDLVEQAETLWPAHPSTLEACTAWLEKAQVLIDGQPSDAALGIRRHPGLHDFEARLVQLRQHAIPRSSQQLAGDQALHPKFAELEHCRAKLTWMRRMLGQETWPTEVDEEAHFVHHSSTLTVQDLLALARPLVDCNPATIKYGGEVKALALVKRALLMASTEEQPECRDLYAWCLFRTGRFWEAQDQQALARLLRSNPFMRRKLHQAERLAYLVMEQQLDNETVLIPGLPTRIDEILTYEPDLGRFLREWSQDAQREKRASEVSDLAVRVERLQSEVNEGRSYEFADAQDRWLYRVLNSLVTDLRELADASAGGLYSSGYSDKHGWGVVRRADAALEIERRSLEAADNVALWREASDAIAAHPWYGGLRISSQKSLLPLGADPSTGLWEFSDIQTGEPALRAADGSLALTEHTGLVFVLIPAGLFLMGAQKESSTARNYDLAAEDTEFPVRLVHMSAFFLSKYEMTQGQWLYLGRNPSAFSASNYSRGWNREGEPWNARHPVEQVSWTECAEKLSFLGFALPTEAQWEYAARAGTTTRWWTGADEASVAHSSNLSDSFAHWHGYEKWDLWDPKLDDGNTVHTAVGSDCPNWFGLHGIIGNVLEWCLDGYEGGRYGSALSSDPLSPWLNTKFRVARGGSFFLPATWARSSSRFKAAPDFRSFGIGVRPARLIEQDPH